MSDKQRRFYMACAIAVIVLFSLGNNTQGTLLTEFSDFYGIGAFAQSLISAVASFGMAAALCLLLAGRFIVSKNLIFVAAVGAVAVSFGLVGFMPPFAVFLALYALLGLAFGFIDAIGSSLIADVSAPPKLTRNMGLLHAFYGLGGILGPVMIRFAADFANADGRFGGVTLTAYLLSGLAAALFIMNCAGYATVKRASPGTLKVPAPLRARELAVFLRKSAIPLLLTTALYGAYLNVVTFRMAQYITVDFGSGELGALSLSALWAGIVISRLVAPRLKLNLRGYLAGGMALTAAFTALGALIGSAPAVIATAFAAGLAGGAVIPMCISELCGLTPDNTLLASGSALLTLYIVQLAGALVAGALTPDAKLGVSLYIAAAYAAAGAAAAAAYKRGTGNGGTLGAYDAPRPPQ